MSVTKYSRMPGPSVRREAAPGGVDVVALAATDGPAEEEHHRPGHEHADDEQQRVAAVRPAERRVLERLDDDHAKHDRLYRAGDRHDRNPADAPGDGGRRATEEIRPTHRKQRRRDAGDEERDR